MSEPTTPKGTQIAPPLPQEILDVAQLVQSGQLAKWKIEKTSNGTTRFHGFDQDGHGILIERREIGSYSRTITETVTRPATISERRKIVHELRQEGRTQAEIADRTGYSQKTISNDCAALELDPPE